MAIGASIDTDAKGTGIEVRRPLAKFAQFAESRVGAILRIVRIMRRGLQSDSQIIESEDEDVKSLCLDQLGCDLAAWPFFPLACNF